MPAFKYVEVPELKYTLEGYLNQIQNRKVSTFDREQLRIKLKRSVIYFYCDSEPSVSGRFA
jgi:hypothetical protein